MDSLHVLKETLKSGVEEKKSIETLFLRLKKEKLGEEEEKEARKVLLCLFRHYRSLSFETLNLAPFPSESDGFFASLSLLGLLRYSFLKKDVSGSFYELLKECGFEGDKEKLYASISEESKHPFVIPEEVKKAPYYYPSLRFEVPEFLFRRLCQDYGREEAFAIASSLEKRSSFLYESYEEGKNPLSLKEMRLSEFDTVYPSERPLGKENTDLYFPVSYVKSKGASEIPLPPLGPSILLISPKSFALPLHFALKTKDSFHADCDVTVESFSLYRKLMDTHYQKAIEGLHVYQSAPKYVKTSLHYDSYDAVIYEGEDSGIGRARLHPEVLASLKEKDFEEAGKKQLEDLVEAAQFVKDGGTLLFTNNALDNEETTSLVSSFLKREKRFRKLKDELILPTSSLFDSGYLALFTKEPKK